MDRSSVFLNKDFVDFTQEEVRLIFLQPIQRDFAGSEFFMVKRESNLSIFFKDLSSEG
jgi:hypothetical protein